jgi:hypothetical protein
MAIEQLIEVDSKIQDVQRQLEQQLNSLNAQLLELKTEKVAIIRETFQYLYQPKVSYLSSNDKKKKHAGLFCNTYDAACKEAENYKPTKTDHRKVKVRVWPQSQLDDWQLLNRFVFRP